MLCLSIFAGVLTVFHSVENKLVKVWLQTNKKYKILKILFNVIVLCNPFKANADYQARIVKLSRRKRENAMRIKLSGSRLQQQQKQARSPTMRKLSFFNGQLEVDHEVRR